MVKHMGRVTKETDGLKKHYNKDISAEDDWSHVTGIDSKKAQESDPMDPQSRIITFSNEISNATKEEIVREKSEKFKDQISSTEQYLKFANELMRQKMNKLRQLKEDEKKFQEEVAILQNKIKSKYDLGKVNVKYMTGDDARSLIFHLEEEYEAIKDKLLYQELIVQRTKDEIAAKRRHLQQVREDLKDILRMHASEVKDPVSVLKEELRKAGISESNRIFQVLNDISDQLKLKNDEKTSSS
ncbi:MAG TPA: hypothetical protein VD828_03065 [Candidatus Nitrosotenuis sp.]|nr:hypothetical protein [Candidatus Nitrosotenuis sp.]